MSDQERLCEDCGKKIRKDKQGIICDKCAEGNIAFYANPPRGIIEANQRRIYGKVMTDNELLKHIQQKGDED